MTYPTFIVIGAYKSGTTALYDYFDQHPQVFMSRVKETNYFVRDELKQRPEGQLVQNQREYQELFAAARDELAVGEASPAYLSHPESAQRIKAAIPDVKLIAILRQPADAFYSDHNMRIRDGRPLEADFETRAAQLNRDLRLGRAKGYYEQLSAFYEAFETDKIKVFLYDDLTRNPRDLMKRAYEFVGVDQTFVPRFTRRNRGGLPHSVRLERLINAGDRSPARRLPGVRLALHAMKSANTRAFPRMPTDVKRDLSQAYSKDIERLSILIDRNLDHWLPE